MKTRLIIFALFLVQQIQAATYYVDFATGNNANNGTSTSTPWQHEPGDVNATGVSDGTTLSAGDTVKFKGGVVYLGGVICNRSGSFGSPITYDGNYAGDWGTGKAIIDREYLINGVGIAASGARGHLVIKNFEIRNVGGWADDATNALSAAAGTYTNTTPAVGTAIDFSTVSGHTNIYVSDIYAHRLGGWRNTAGWTAATVSGGAIFFKNSGLITITNCEMTKMQVALGLYSQSGNYTTDILIVSNNIHNYITWGMDLAQQTDFSVIQNVNIRGNRIHDYAEFVSGNWAGVGEWPHTDGIFVRNAGLRGAWTNLNIFHNQFYCDGNTGNGGTACIFVSQGPSCNIYSNLFNVDSQTRFIGVEYPNLATNSQVVNITNNTFIGNPPMISLAGETNSAYRRVVIRNNIFRKLSGQSQNGILLNLQATNVDPYEMDNNVYFDPDWSSSLKYVMVTRSTGYSTLATVQGLGFDLLSLYSDPAFTTLSGTPSLTDTRLTASSPARGLAQNGGDAGWLPYEAGGSSTTYRGYSTGGRVQLIGPGRLTQ